VVIKDDNRGSYFLLKVGLPNFGLLDQTINRKIESNLDIVLAQSTATHNIYKFDSVRNDKFIYLFSTNVRKRRGQIERLVTKHLVSNKLVEEFEVVGLLKSEFVNYIEQLKNKQSLKITDEPVQFEGYKGKDIELFNKRENWHKWQEKFYNTLFYKTGGVREPDDRKIHFLFDSEGASGKSSFFKFLYFKNPDKIARLSYGSSQQLRSLLVNSGTHEIYIIDLARTKGKNDSPGDLISVLEDLKSGVVINALYGRVGSLLMEPPHIIVSSNFLFDMEYLSADRWQINEIKNNDLVDITNKVKRENFKKESLKKLQPVVK